MSTYFVIAAAAVSLLMALGLYRRNAAIRVEDARMKEIAGYIHDGAMAYLKRQYVVMAVFAAVMFVVLLVILGLNTALCFLVGALFSMLAGFCGMMSATLSNVRTAQSAKKGMPAALNVAFSGGAVLGLCVVGLGALGLAVLYLIFDGNNDILTGFSLGASSIALFARVGGGIYTKAADVGADIVGKVETDLPEDDPRNPATIADNVGDNVGDVAGMGADLYESYCGSILSTMALGASAFYSAGPVMQTKAILAPMLIAAVGVVLSVISIFTVRTKEGAGMGELLKSMSFGTNLAAILSGVATFGILALVFGTGNSDWWHFSCSVVAGLLAGVIIGKATEF